MAAFRTKPFRYGIPAPPVSSPDDLTMAWFQFRPLSHTIVPAVVIPGGAAYNPGVDKIAGFRLFREFFNWKI